MNWTCELSTFICGEFFKQITKPTKDKFDLHRNASVLMEIFTNAQKYLQTLKPESNMDTFECFLFDIKRTLWALKRASLIPDAETERGVISETVSQHPELLEEHEALHEENERLWMKFSRRSEWSNLDRMYSRVENSIKEILDQ